MRVIKMLEDLSIVCEMCVCVQPLRYVYSGTKGFPSHNYETTLRWLTHCSFWWWAQYSFSSFLFGSIFPSIREMKTPFSFFSCLTFTEDVCLSGWESQHLEHTWAMRQQAHTLVNIRKKRWISLLFRLSSCKCLCEYGQILFEPGFRSTA